MVWIILNHFYYFRVLISVIDCGSSNRRRGKIYLWIKIITLLFYYL